MISFFDYIKGLMMLALMWFDCGINKVFFSVDSMILALHLDGLIKATFVASAEISYNTFVLYSQSILFAGTILFSSVFCISMKHRWWILFIPYQNCPTASNSNNAADPEAHLMIKQASKTMAAVPETFGWFPKHMGFPPFEIKWQTFYGAQVTWETWFAEENSPLMLEEVENPFISCKVHFEKPVRNSRLDPVSPWFQLA